MKSKRTQEFYELYGALPTGIQKQADKAYERFEENPDHLGLNFKPVGHDPVWYSARIWDPLLCCLFHWWDAYV